MVFSASLSQILYSLLRTLIICDLKNSPLPGNDGWSVSDQMVKCNNKGLEKMLHRHLCSLAKYSDFDEIFQTNSRSLSKIKTKVFFIL